MINKPVILVPPVIDDEKNMLYAKKQYLDVLTDSGALPVIMPMICDTRLIDEYINMCDGILIMGGIDADARLYGDVNRVYNGRISPQRDYLEIYIIKQAAQKKIPLFGICRGVQILNIAMGGTLYQDINAQLGELNIYQHQQKAPEWHHTHSVTVAKNSWIYKALELDKLDVNSMHHQAVKDIAPEFEAVCRSGDGIIEAIENTEHKMIGVQWHPELMHEKEQKKLFIEFVSLCAEYKSKQGELT